MSQLIDIEIWDKQLKAKSCLEIPRNHWLPVQSATTLERLIWQLLYFVNMVTESMITFLLIVASIEARYVYIFFS